MNLTLGVYIGNKNIDEQEFIEKNIKDRVK